MSNPPTIPRDVVEQCRVLWERGDPINQIAQAVGRSRNSIAGIAHRNGFTKRDSPVQRQAPLRGGPVAVPADRAAHVIPDRPPTPSEATPTDPPADLPASLFLPPEPQAVGPARRGGCRWPMGDPKTGGFRFCDAAREPGCRLPYCEEHHRRATARPQVEEEVA